MNTLIIIGNGFDLAHGLETNYSSFINYIEKTLNQNKNSFPNLIDIQLHHTANPPPSRSDIRSLYNSYKNKIFKNPNDFFPRLYAEFRLKNWCDIEDFYYKILKECESDSEMRKLNSQFKKLENVLEIYLQTQKLNGNIIKEYSDFFKLHTSKNSLILNFNYTKTLDYYIPKESDLKVINIHGELNSADNPIIFGYAADEKESNQLLFRGDQEYLRHIKQYCYNRTSNERKLNDFLSSQKEIEVYILGHSCGMSDLLILKQIFAHNNVMNIKPLYYNEYDNYYNVQININRIVQDRKHFKRLLNYDDLHRMPQHSDNSKQKESFSKYLNFLRKERDKKFGSGTLPTIGIQ